MIENKTLETLYNHVSVREYSETYGVTDIYMLYSTYSPFCGDSVQSRLRDCLD